VSAVRTISVPHRFGESEVAELLSRLGGRTVSVCIPCRDEAATVGSLVRVIRRQLIERFGVVDEMIVLDDRSTDDTATVAVHAGSRVVAIDDVHEAYGVGAGKGNVLWASLLVSHGDFIIWCDGDVTSFEPDWILRLLWPLAHDETINLVKAFYHRPADGGGGGRTTELVARPLISRFFPELTRRGQPLSGEFAGRRSALEQLPFEQGWGVEMGLLIDIADTFGAASIGQVDLGVRMHRHRSLQSLSVQSAEVMAVVLARAGVAAETGGAKSRDVLWRSDDSEVPLNLATRPSLASLGLSRHSAT